MIVKVHRLPVMYLRPGLVAGPTGRPSLINYSTSVVIRFQHLRWKPMAIYIHIYIYIYTYQPVFKLGEVIIRPVLRFLGLGLPLARVLVLIDTL